MMNKLFPTILFFLFLFSSCRQQPDFMVGSTEEFYIKKAKAVYAANAFDEARSLTYQYFRNYPNAMEASIKNYFKDRVHAIVSENMGTASFGGSGNPGIPFRNEDRTWYPLQSACD